MNEAWEHFKKQNTKIISTAHKILCISALPIEIPHALECTSESKVGDEITLQKKCHRKQKAESRQMSLSYCTHHDDIEATVFTEKIC